MGRQVNEPACGIGILLYIQQDGPCASFAPWVFFTNFPWEIFGSETCVGSGSASCVHWAGLLRTYPNGLRKKMKNKQLKNKKINLRSYSTGHAPRPPTAQPDP